MFTARWRIFRLAGIPIYIDASWFIILLLITWTFTGIFQDRVPGLPPSDYWIMGLIGAISFFICVVLHELGHATVGRAQGMPIRGITLFMFGGVAELGGEPPSARSEFLMAIAGPIVSAILGALFWLAANLGEQAGAPVPVVAVLAYLAKINWIVLIFNLIPAFPLDGGRVLRSALWGMSRNLRRATRWAAGLGQGFAWLMILLGVISFVLGFELAHGSDARLHGAGYALMYNGVWLGLIGLFLNNAARDSYRQVLIQQALRGEPISQFMNRQPIVVSRFLDLRSWVEDYVYRYHRKMFPVATDGHLEGFVTTQALQRFPRSEWDQHTIAEVMRRDVDAVTIPQTADALTALAKMQGTGSSRLLVVDGDRIAGILTLKDLLHFLQVKMELQNSRNDDRQDHGSVEQHEHYVHT